MSSKFGGTDIRYRLNEEGMRILREAQRGTRTGRGAGGWSSGRHPPICSNCYGYMITGREDQLPGGSMVIPARCIAHTLFFL